jgi:hypothetical protein
LKYSAKVCRFVGVEIKELNRRYVQVLTLFVTHRVAH